MTAKTEKLYWAIWLKAWKAHWAGERQGEAITRAGLPEHHEMRDRVVAVARQIVARTGGPLGADALRHACHILATGKDCGHRSLTHKQVTQVLAVFRQLQGIDLSAMAITAEGEAETARLRGARRQRAADAGSPAAAYPVAGREAAIRGIEALGFPEDYLARISGDRWKRARWRELSPLQLTQLLMTLKARAAVRAIADHKRAVLPGGL